MDPKLFEGTCYRAANWIEVGKSKGFGRSRLDFYQLHAQPKSIFLYPLHRQAQKHLSAACLPANLKPYEQGFGKKTEALYQFDEILLSFETEQRIGHLWAG